MKQQKVLQTFPKRSYCDNLNRELMMQEHGRYIRFSSWYKMFRFNTVQFYHQILKELWAESMIKKCMPTFYMKQGVQFIIIPFFFTHNDNLKLWWDKQKTTCKTTWGVAGSCNPGINPVAAWAAIQAASWVAICAATLRSAFGARRLGTVSMRLCECIA